MSPATSPQFLAQTDVFCCNFQHFFQVCLLHFRNRTLYFTHKFKTHINITLIAYMMQYCLNPVSVRAVGKRHLLPWGSIHSTWKHTTCLPRVPFDATEFYLLDLFHLSGSSLIFTCSCLLRNNCISCCTVLITFLRHLRLIKSYCKANCFTEGNRPRLKFQW